MKNVLETTVETKKVNAGHYEVTVTQNIQGLDGGIQKKYTETDMTIIDNLDSDNEDERFEAMQSLIQRSGIED